MKIFTDKDLILIPGKSKEMKYRRGVVKKGIHIGQAKLFFSELLVITNYFNKIDSVLYIGSSRGRHINFFPELFPGIKVYCYDPADSDVDTSLEGIYEYRKLFDDKDIEIWKERAKKEKILLISDIRTFVPGKISQEEEQVGIRRDMYLQKKWVDEIQPYVFHLKFRMPYYYKEEDLYFDYLDGKIYIEPWNHTNSAENRLVGVRKKNGFPSKKWNTRIYEDMCFYLNTKMRNPDVYTDENSFYNIITKDERPYNEELKNDIDSTITMYTIYEYLKKFRSLPKDNDKIIEELVSFFYECMRRISYKKKSISIANKLHQDFLFKNKYIEHDKFFTYKGKKYNYKKIYHDITKNEFINIPDFTEEDRDNILLNTKNEDIAYLFTWYPIGKSMKYGPDYVKQLSKEEKEVLLKYINEGNFEIKNILIDQLDVTKFVEFENITNFFGRIYNLIRYQNLQTNEDDIRENEKVIENFFSNLKKYLE